MHRLHPSTWDHIAVFDCIQFWRQVCCWLPAGRPRSPPTACEGAGFAPAVRIRPGNDGQYQRPASEFGRRYARRAVIDRRASAGHPAIQVRWARPTPVRPWPRSRFPPPPTSRSSGLPPRVGRRSGVRHAPGKLHHRRSGRSRRRVDHGLSRRRGGSLANINAGGDKLQLPPVIDLAGGSSAAGGQRAHLLIFEGANNGTRMLAAIVPRTDETWFIKLTDLMPWSRARSPPFSTFSRP